MLLGEHAVLHGKQAIVVAINHYIEISLSPRTDRKVQIFSAEFGAHLLTLDKFRITKAYEYVLTAIQSYLKKITCGFTLKIRSDFSANLGFGSSAAVTVAMVGILELWLEGKTPDLMRLYQQAVKVVRLVQGVGSGADVAASVFGGVIAYKMWPLKIQRLNFNLPLVAIYSGHKTSTATVITAVKKQQEQFPAIFSGLYMAIDRCSNNAIIAIKKNALIRLGEIMNMHQGLQDAMGVNNAVLTELILALRAQPNIYGAKISGAGMGDCVIGLGKIKTNTFPQNSVQKRLGIKQIDVAVSDVGFGLLT